MAGDNLSERDSHPGGLVAPRPLLATPGAVHVAYAGLIGVYLAGLRRGPLASLSGPLGADRDARRLGLSFLLALLTVQALFEPDYGSYLRHLTPVLPLLLCILARTKMPPREMPPRPRATNLEPGRARSRPRAG